MAGTEIRVDLTPAEEQRVKELGRDLLNLVAAKTNVDEAYLLALEEIHRVDGELARLEDEAVLRYKGAVPRELAKAIQSLEDARERLQGKLQRLNERRALETDRRAVETIQEELADIQQAARKRAYASADIPRDEWPSELR